MAASLGKLLIFLAVLVLSLCQQICLKQECAAQVAGCDAACQELMGKCMFSCTMNSYGCLQKCMWGNAPALALLECSFTKCIAL